MNPVVPETPALVWLMLACLILAAALALKLFIEWLARDEAPLQEAQRREK